VDFVRVWNWRSLGFKFTNNGGCTELVAPAAVQDATAALMAARHIPNCHRCGVTINASEAYIVKPELVTRINSRGRRFHIWTRPHFHVDQTICGRHEHDSDHGGLTHICS
jgi:hypothetical protein